MTESYKNLWAPWRMEYIEGLSDSDEGCFLCRAAEQNDRDEENLVLFRGSQCFTIMNRFPYNNGHLLIAPYTHMGLIEDLDDAILLEMMQQVKRMTGLVQQALNAEGFNIGINLSHCAGAGLPDHFHVHIVPRWSGDTNFMAIVGKVRVIPEALGRTYRKIKECMERS